MVRLLRYLHGIPICAIQMLHQTGYVVLQWVQVLWCTVYMIQSYSSQQHSQPHLVLLKFLGQHILCLVQVLKVYILLCLHNYCVESIYMQNTQPSGSPKRSENVAQPMAPNRSPTESGSRGSQAVEPPCKTSPVPKDGANATG